MLIREPIVMNDRRRSIPEFYRCLPSSPFGGLELEPKAAAFAGFGFDAVLAAHTFDGLGDDGEADAGAGVGMDAAGAFANVPSRMP